LPTGEGLICDFALTFGSLSSPSGSDHHTDEIGVSTHFGLDRPCVEARLNDKNDDDRFEWRIDVAAIESRPLDHGELPELVALRFR
jgi:hypothetical protein